MPLRLMGGRAAIRTGLVVLLAASAACSPSTATRAGPTATVGTEPPRTTTTNPYAIPDILDVAYVNRVLAGLDAVIGDTVRLIIRTRTIPPEALGRLRAIYADGNLLQLAIDSFQSDMRKGFSNYKPNPGNETTSVTQLLTAKTNCIFARVERNYAQVGANVSSSAGTEWAGLQRLEAGRDPSGYNPTGWAFIYEGFPPGRTQPTDPCTA